MRSGNFVEETTTSIAGTAGNGAVTLTAITNTPRFSTVLGATATTVRYTIEDTTAGKFETGIGSVASNVLTRTKPQITWDGTTFLDHAPAPLAFGATPTSGNIKIRIATVSEGLAIPMPGRQTLIAGDGAWDFYPLSKQIAANSNGVTRNFVANTEYYACFYVENAGVLSGAQIQVNTAGAGSIKWALYDVDATGLPKNKLVQFNTTSVSATGIKTDSAISTWTPANSLWIPSGWYCIGFIADVAVGFNGSTTNPSNTLFNRANGYGYGDTIRVAGSFATGLPAVANLTGGILAGAGDNGNAWLGLKVVA